MFIGKNRGDSTKIVWRTTDVEEAMLGEAAQFRVEGVGYISILELAKARCEASPDYSRFPDPSQRYVQYRSNKGNFGIYEVIREFAPDDVDGQPQWLELYNAKYETSFNGKASACKVIDLDKLPKELADAILRGAKECEEENIGSTPKLTKGLRK